MDRPLAIKTQFLAATVGLDNKQDPFVAISFRGFYANPLAPTYLYLHLDDGKRLLGDLIALFDKKVVEQLVKEHGSRATNGGPLSKKMEK